MDTNYPKHKIHHILAHSYSVFLLFLFVGIVLDVAFRLKIFKTTLTLPFGLLVLALGTFIILWAQHTSRKLEKDNLTWRSFSRGPYAWSRSPTHWGLFLLLLGFAIIANAFFVALFTIISFFITRYTFLAKEEEALEEKYGEPYREYKKVVKL